MYKQKIGVFFGRFQMFHIGHADALTQALEQVDDLIILVGSVNQRVSTKNPFSYNVRSNIIEQWFQNQQFMGQFRGKSLIILPLNDYKYMDAQWVSDSQETVNYAINRIKRTAEQDVRLYGFDKDASTYYLKLFPQWRPVMINHNLNMDATPIRQRWLSVDQSLAYDDVKLLTNEMCEYLVKHRYDEDLQADWDYYNITEVAKFAGYPYMDCLQFNAADALVECAGHVLLGTRKNAPGRNCRALPGGMKESRETFLQCALRELNEETGLKVPRKVLLGSIKKEMRFDDPGRSFGIPRVTVAQYIVIDPNNDGTLPHVKGSDDLKEAEWVPIEKAMNELVMYDDHKDIITALTGVVERPAYMNKKYRQVI